MVNVTIKRSTANSLRNFMEDVIHIDERAGCSDATFRNHFLDRLKILKAIDAYNDLDAAIQAADEKDDEEQAEQKKTAKKGK